MKKREKRRVIKRKKEKEEETIYFLLALTMNFSHFCVKISNCYKHGDFFFASYSFED